MEKEECRGSGVAESEVIAAKLGRLGGAPVVAMWQLPRPAGGFAGPATGPAEPIQQQPYQLLAS